MGGTIRLFNMHPKLGFVGNYQSKVVIHQPAKGEWALKKEKVENKKSARGWSWKTTLVCINPDKIMPNWIDMPEDYVKTCLGGNMSGLGRGDEPDTHHHGGFIKHQKEVDKIVTSEFTDKLAKLKEVEKQIAEKQALLEKITVATHTKASEPKGERKA